MHKNDAIKPMLVHTVICVQNFVVKLHKKRLFKLAMFRLATKIN